MTAKRPLHPAIVPVVFFASVFLILFAVYRFMLPNAYAQPFTAQSSLALLADKDVLPRNIALKTFDPHRDAAGFACRLQAERAPALTPAAQALHEEALTLSSPALWPNERNWPRAMQLWQQAAAQGHWKAALMALQVGRSGQGLNSEKGQFKVPAQDPETVVSGMEGLMRQGVADAFYWMGVFWSEGYGLPKFDTTRAWALWELAADLGSPLAQTAIAKALPYAKREQEKPNEANWANRQLMYRLLECAHAQGHGAASHELGSWLALQADDPSRRLPRFATPEAQYRFALQVLHDGVKFGSEDAAGYLSSSLRSGDPIAPSGIDEARADRYHKLAKALYNNPDLRFPNLDRVIPLPPAKLPAWNGKLDSLVQAAQGVRVTPQLPKQSAANAPGRARVPEGHSLVMPTERRVWAEQPIVAYQGILSAPGVRTGLAVAAYEGYYQPLHIWATHPKAQPKGGLPLASEEVLRMRALAKVPPLHFAMGARLSLMNDAYGYELNFEFEKEGNHRLVYWRYVGTARAVTPLQDHLARAGWVQAIGQVAATAKSAATLCGDGQACPTSGVWQPEVTHTQHPLAQVFNASLSGESWRRQAFVPAGQALPSLAAQLGPVLAEGEGEQLKVQWRLMLACEGVLDSSGAA